MKILFPTDGSYHSDYVLENIIAQPWTDGTQCKVLTVPAPFGGGFMLGGIAAMATTAENALMKDLQKMLTETEEKLAEKFGKQNVSASLEEGHPAKTIVDTASNWGADLIVMGAHGTSGYNDDFLGGTTTKVADHATCSVQIVNDLTSASVDKKSKKHLPMEEARFLIAIHDSVHSAAVIESMLSRKFPPESIFQVLAVVPEPKQVVHSRFFKDPAIDQAHKELYKQLKARLEKLAKDAADKLIAKVGKDKVTYHVLEGNVPSLILQIAQDWPADMIFIGAHGSDHDVFEHFTGSVPENVVKNADCSVEIVRKKG
jgi:nucleotide-binding universal stress UspA family protein